MSLNGLTTVTAFSLCDHDGPFQVSYIRLRETLDYSCTSVKILEWQELVQLRGSFCRVLSF